ncbi:MAG: hypothetical protein WD552_01745 [Candidatus Paceibacterota bacterium]
MDINNRNKESNQMILSEIMRWFLALMVALLTVILSSGCNLVENIDKRSVVDIPLDNQDNCTEAIVYDANGSYLGTIPAHTVGMVQASRKLFDMQDETYIAFQTPQHIIDRILAGDTSVLPKGCDNWGYDNTRIRLRNGYETDLERIRLRPPRYWEEPEHWKALSSEEQVATESFWDSQGVTLDVENPETEVLIQ